MVLFTCPKFCNFILNSNPIVLTTIYHNPRCSKSREGLEILKESGQEFEVREYLKNPLSEEELKNLLQDLGMAPMELIRTSEKVWKENYKGRDLNQAELIRIMVQHPSLIQRPIVKKDGQAVVGRPSENITRLLG